MTTEAKATKPKTPKVIVVKVKDLIPDPKNPNKMPKEKFAALCVSVRENGMVQPILIGEWVPSIVDGKAVGGGHPIVDGHHRTDASKLAGITEVLAVVWDGTEEMRQAFAIGMNNIKGELDLAAVQVVVADLAANGWTVQDTAMATGYSEGEINDLLKVATDLSPDDVMSQPIAQDEDERPRVERPLVLELTFASKEELQRARRGLKKAAGKGGELGVGLLTLLGGTE